MARQGFFIADMLGEKIGKFTVRRSDDFASLWIKNRYFVEIRFVYNTSCKNGIGLLVSVSDRDNNNHEVDHIINYYNFSVFGGEIRIWPGGYDYPIMSDGSENPVLWSDYKITEDEVKAIKAQINAIAKAL